MRLRIQNVNKSKLLPGLGSAIVFAASILGSSALAQSTPATALVATQLDGEYKGLPLTRAFEEGGLDRSGPRQPCTLRYRPDGSTYPSPTLTIRDGQASVTACNKTCTLKGQVNPGADYVFLKTNELAIPVNLTVQFRLDQSNRVVAQGTFDFGQCRYFFSWVKKQ